MDAQQPAAAVERPLGDGRYRSNSLLTHLAGLLLYYSLYGSLAHVDQTNAAKRVVPFVSHMLIKVEGAEYRKGQGSVCVCVCVCVSLCVCSSMEKGGFCEWPRIQWSLRIAYQRKGVVKQAVCHEQWLARQYTNRAPMCFCP
jgi:hypothetical protein